MQTMVEADHAEAEKQGKAFIDTQSNSSESAG